MKKSLFATLGILALCCTSFLTYHHVYTKKVQSDLAKRFPGLLISGHIRRYQ